METTTTATKYIPTKECATMMKTALKAAYPGVKFSVRKGTGTGSSWIHVSWTDGPTERAVSEIVDRYTGSHYNGMDDSYVQHPDVLIAIEGEELPQKVHFICCGVNTTRTISEGAEADIMSQFAQGVGNAPLEVGNVEGLEINGVYIGRARDMSHAIWQVHAGTNYCA